MEKRAENRSGNGAAGSILWGLQEDGANAGGSIQTPQNPHISLQTAPTTQLRLTVERAPRDQLRGDEEGAQLLHQLGVGEAAPAPQGGLVQQRDAPGHEEATIRSISREEGSLEVDSPRASPRADVLHGCCWGTPQSLSGPQSSRPTRNTRADPPDTSPGDTRSCRAVLWGVLWAVEALSGVCTHVAARSPLVQLPQPQSRPRCCSRHRART